MTFVTSAPDLDRCPTSGPPEVAFAGRSNSGKSSVLNRLTGSRRTAKVSKTPGRTRELNYFEVRGGGYLVDLPGYGFAKAQKKEQQAWQRAVNEYLSYRETLTGLVLVMDIRRPLEPLDLELIEWAAASQLPLHALLNKADKLGRGAADQQLRKVTASLAPHVGATAQTFSAQAGSGLQTLYQRVSGWLDG